MEEVFADVFYDFGEAPNSKVALDAYIDLVDLYLRVLRETTNWLCDDTRRGAPIGRLLAAAAKHSDDLSIITFNHDLVIENEINRRAQLRRRWCIDKCYGSLSNDLKVLRPVGSAASAPTFPIHEAGDCDHDAPISVLKLHGSLNWMVRLQGRRPTARLLSGQSHPDIQLLIRRQLAGRELFLRGGRGRGRQRWHLWPIVVPPVYAKQALRGAVQKAWADARDVVATAERMIVFGYSLPAIDIEAEKLFERALARNTQLAWIDVVNPASASAARFAGVGVSKPLRWYPSVEKLLERDDFA